MLLTQAREMVRNMNEIQRLDFFFPAELNNNVYFFIEDGKWNFEQKTRFKI